MPGYYHVLIKKSWGAGIAAVIVIATIIYAPKLNKHLSSGTVESKCMKIMEATAQAARLKGPEEHAQAIFNAMATPECKTYVSHAKSQQY